MSGGASSNNHPLPDPIDSDVDQGFNGGQEENSHSKSNAIFNQAAAQRMRTLSSPTESCNLSKKMPAISQAANTASTVIVIDGDDQKSSLDQTPKDIVDLTSSVASSGDTQKTQKQKHSKKNYRFSHSSSKNQIIELDTSSSSFTSSSSSSSSSFQQSRKKRKRNNTSMSTFNCPICLEDGVEKWKGHSLIRCRHQFCLPCLANHIKLSPTTKVKCPCCPIKMEIFDVQSIFISVGNKKEWHSFSEKASAEMLEEEITVGPQSEGQGETRRCPAERCNYMFVYEPRNPEVQEGTRFNCPQCRSKFCLQCGANGGKVGPSHEGSCYDRREQLKKEENERRKFEEWKRENSQADARFYELLEQESGKGLTKPCPRCKSAITKNGGCNHMHCSYCNYSFNWSEARLIDRNFR